ncbi:MAG TPA: 3-oxoadipate enol-lactonase [Terriglobales bacterium]|nr:3-oxoadipate enol-lactonase [Terriglobales bacterium]
MPFAELGDIRVRYRWDGPNDAPVLVFSNSLGTDLEMWDLQVERLAGGYRILRYDTRGHGETSVTPGPYTIEQLGRDVLSLIDELGIDRCHFCGLSMGGQIGLWLGINAPDRLKSLVVANSGTAIGTPTGWNERISRAKSEGMHSVAKDVAERWFTPQFRYDHPDMVKRIVNMLESTSAEGYANCCAAVRDCSLTNEITRISIPTLLIAGEFDPATPPALSTSIAAAVKASRYECLPAAHLSNVECADQFTVTLRSFIEAQNG